MITNNFSFNGSGGRVNRLDASRNYAVPLTTPVYKDYSIDVDLSGYGQVTAVSLDGRLWLFQQDDSIDFVALRWDESEGKMKFASSLNFMGNSEVVLARGLDWILTSKNIFLVTDEDPYIRQATLFDENITDTFLYSALRHSSVPLSGSDPFTKQAWGKRSDNGNSTGNARFSRDTHLLYPAGTHTFEQCYSLLPAVGDWIIFENFLIRRPDNPLDEHFNYMLNVRPLLPLELLEGTAAFGTGYNFNHRGIQLAYINSQLWGRGLYHIGRVFIFPNSFDENEEPQGYYLYISPDFPNVNSALDANSSWLNVALASMGGENPCGFVSSEPMPVTGGACITAENSDVLELQEDATTVWRSLSQRNGKLIFDYSNQNALLLDDEGARVFLNGLTSAFDYKCPTLRQWLAPADILEAVCDHGIIASADRTAFFTNFGRGFHREVFTPCALPLTGTTYMDAEENHYRLSFAANTQGFDVLHSFAARSLQASTIWEDIYREPIKLTFANLCDRTDQEANYSEVAFYPPTSDSSYPMDEGSYNYWRNQTPYRMPLYYKINSFSVLGMANYPAYSEATAHYQVTHVGPNEDGIYNSVQFSLANRTAIGIVLACSATCSYIDPVSGQIKSFDLSFECNSDFEVYSYRFSAPRQWETRYSLRSQFHEVPDSVACVGDDIGFMCYVYNRGEGYYPYTKLTFYPVMPIPDDLRRWIDHSLYPYGTFQAAMLCPAAGVNLLPFKENPSASKISYIFWGSQYPANAYFDAIADSWTVIVKTVAHKVPFALHFSIQEDLLPLLRSIALERVGIFYTRWFIFPDNYSSSLQDEEGNLWAHNVALVFFFGLYTYSQSDEVSGSYVRNSKFFALTFHVQYSNLILDSEEEGILL